MNLLIVFAFAGDSTMTRFLAIAERPKLVRRRRNSSRVHHARAYAGRRIDRAADDNTAAGTAGGAGCPRLGHHYLLMVLPWQTPQPVAKKKMTCRGALGNLRCGPCPLTPLLRRLRRRQLCTFSSCCRASCTRCPGSRQSCGG